MRGRQKDLLWLRGQVKTPPFSPAGRIEAGVLLRQLQNGEKLSLPHSRPMPSIGAGCHELRVHDREGAWRLFYFIDADAIVVLDVTDKKTRKTPQQILKQCANRLKSYRAAQR
jgi:phage-related protein